MTDTEKLFLMYAKLKDNKQDGMQAIVYTARGSDKTYRELLDMLIKADPPIIKAHKMNSMTEKSKEPCRGFQKGSCKFGERCKYAHTVSKTPGSVPQEKQAYNKKKETSQSKYKPPIGKNVTFEQRSKLGAPRGQPSARNPEGYSIKQLNMLRDDLKSESVDNWQNPDYFQQSSPQQTHAYMNMLKAVPGSPAPPTPPRERIFSLEGGSIAQIKIISERCEEFLNHHGYIPKIQNLLVYVNTHPSTSAADTSVVYKDRKMFVGFRWLSSYHPIFNISRRNWQVKEAHKDVMNLIYANSTFFDARCFPPEDQNNATHLDYNLFDPAGGPHYYLMEPGHYSSSMRSIANYYSCIEIIMRIRVDGEPDTCIQHILMLGAVYDIMSYISNRYRDFDTRQSIQAIRTIVLNEIEIEALKYPQYSVASDIFRAIASTIRPPPNASPLRPTSSTSTIPRMSTQYPETESDADLSGIDTDDDLPLQKAAKRRDDKLEDNEEDELASSDGEYPDERDRHQRKRDVIFYNKTPTPQGKLGRKERNALRFPESPEAETPIRPRDPNMSQAQFLQQEYWHDEVRNYERAAEVAEARGTTLPQYVRSQSIVHKFQADLDRAAEEAARSLTSSSSTPTSRRAITLAPSPVPGTPPVTPPPRSSRKSTSSTKSQKLNLLHLTGQSHNVMAMTKKMNKTIIDSGASTSGTGHKGQLTNIRPTKCTVNAAFGESFAPTEMGDLPPYMLSTIVIDDMKDTTLLSVSQACAKGMCGVFTSKDCQFFSIQEMLPHLSNISKTCKPMLRGEVEDGLYIQKSL